METVEAFDLTPQGRWKAFLAREMSEQEVRNELRVANFAVIVLLVAMSVCVWVGLRFGPQLGVALASLSAVLAVYYGPIVRALVHRGKGLQALRVVNVTIEVTAPALVSLIDTHIMGGVYALTSTPPLLTFIAVAVSALRFSRMLSIYAGVLSALQYLGLYALACRTFDEDTVARLPALGVGHAINHAVYLLLAGVLGAMSAQVGRWMILRVVTHIVERDRTRALFGAYLAPEAAARLLDGPVTLQGEGRVLTVLFADIRNFTPLASTLAPERTVAYLNDYFAHVCPVIARNSGMVNKFVGDGLLAVFGAPGEDPQHAFHAAQAALEIVAAASSVLRPDGKPTRVGVGVHTGQVVLGSVGTSWRRDYTVIGDTVNVAARLEALTRECDADVLLSESTVLAAGGELETLCQGPTLLKGRDEPVVVHKLVSMRRAWGPQDT